MSADRTGARALAREYSERGDPTGWFEALYAQADGDAGVISWADLEPNPNLVEWLTRRSPAGTEMRALKVGCGLGDDAEELAHRGFEVTESTPLRPRSTGAGVDSQIVT